jgi:hypothetical protein
MIVEQTVEIPENHRIYLDIPSQIPTGRTKITLTIIDLSQERNREPVVQRPSGTQLGIQAAPPEHTEAPVIPLLELRGSCKGEDTIAAYLDRKRADKALEFEHDRRISGQ